MKRIIIFIQMENTTITKWFLIVGKIEGYSYLLLLFIAMPLKYLYNTPEYVRPMGSIHGVLFVAFMILLALMFFKVKLSFKNSVLAFLLSLVPFGTFFLKRLV
jgi:integral membrane protein